MGCHSGGSLFCWCWEEKEHRCYKCYKCYNSYNTQYNFLPSCNLHKQCNEENNQTNHTPHTTWTRQAALNKTRKCEPVSIQRLAFDCLMVDITTHTLAVYVWWTYSIPKWALVIPYHNELSKFTVEEEKTLSKKICLSHAATIQIYIFLL